MRFHSRFVLLALLVPGLVTASTFSYELTLAGVDPTTLAENSTAWNIDFTTAGAPFDGSLSDFISLNIGSPGPGLDLIPREIGFTPFLNPDNVESGEISLVFGENFLVGVQYVIFATDAFWAAPGDKTFAATDDLSATDGVFMNTFTDGLPPFVGPTGSEVCTACSAVIAGVPEPGSIALEATSLAACWLLLQRRRRKLISWAQRLSE